MPNVNIQKLFGVYGIQMNGSDLCRQSQRCLKARVGSIPMEPAIGKHGDHMGVYLSRLFCIGGRETEERNPGLL